MSTGVALFHLKRPKKLVILLLNRSSFDKDTRISTSDLSMAGWLSFWKTSCCWTARAHDISSSPVYSLQRVNLWGKVNTTSDRTRSLSPTSSRTSSPSTLRRHVSDFECCILWELLLFISTSSILLSALSVEITSFSLGQKLDLMDWFFVVESRWEPFVK